VPQSAPQSAPAPPPAEGALPPASGAPAEPEAPPLPREYTPLSPVRYIGNDSSTYIPDDSWMYPALLRLYSLGYLDRAFLGLRPWTRLAVLRMLEESGGTLATGPDDDAAEEARGIFDALWHELSQDINWPSDRHDRNARLETVYGRVLGISGPPLYDSFHFGQTVINDYGRPYQEGLNAYAGVSARANAGHFSLYFRGEYQHAPSAPGYSPFLAYALSSLDLIPAPPAAPAPATIPLGPIATADRFRVLEGYASAHVLGHEVSFGKTDEWMGPALGGSFAYSNNAENIYGFRINRVEPLGIPLLSRLLGPVRYDFVVGSLKGHTYPNAPWAHAEKFSFRPTRDFEFGFERTVIWGGKGHSPITLHTFLRSFFSLNDTTPAVKFSRDDPGARFTAFDFSWRLPGVRNWLTLYTDSEAHDDVTPVSAPRRAGIRPGLYLSHFPGAPHLDLRVEAASTDPPTRASTRGNFMYWEIVQRQGYTNKGNIFGDWIGREAKGGQAWLNWHLSGDEWIQLYYRNQKAAFNFLSGGTTVHDGRVEVVKRLTRDLEADLWVQYESWKAPGLTISNARKTNTSTMFQLTWYPRRVQGF
jgi:hypothetical protein